MRQFHDKRLLPITKGPESFFRCTLSGVWTHSKRLKVECSWTPGDDNYFDAELFWLPYKYIGSTAIKWSVFLEAS